MLTFTAFTAISAYGMVKSICKTQEILQRKKEYLENIVSSNSIVPSEIIPNKPFILKHVVPQTMMAALPIEYELFQDSKSNKIITTIIEQYPIPPKEQIDPVSTEQILDRPICYRYASNRINIFGINILFPIFYKGSLPIRCIYKDNTLINLVDNCYIYTHNPSFGVTFLGQPMRASHHGTGFSEKSFKHIPREHICYPFDYENMFLKYLGINDDLYVLSELTGLEFLKKNVGYIHLEILNCENQVMYFDVICRDNILEYQFYDLCPKELAHNKFHLALTESKIETALILVNYLIVGVGILKYLVKN
jgi:hypothetical protein